MSKYSKESLKMAKLRSEIFLNEIAIFEEMHKSAVESRLLGRNLKEDLEDLFEEYREDMDDILSR